MKKIAGDFACTHPTANIDPHPSTVVEIEVTVRFAKRHGFGKPLGERASTIQAFADDELLAEVQRRGLVPVYTSTGPNDPGSDDGADDDIPF